MPFLGPHNARRHAIFALKALLTLHTPNFIRRTHYQACDHKTEDRDTQVNRPSLKFALWHPLYQWDEDHA